MLFRSALASALRVSSQIRLMATATDVGVVDCGIADVHMVNMFSDNYGYILVCKQTGKAAVVDPGDPEPVFDKCNDLGVSPSLVLCTHKHADHSGGNGFFLDKYKEIKVVGTKYETIPGNTDPIGDGETIALGSLNIKAMFTPCHTKGHVVFHVTPSQLPTGAAMSPGILFSGDTLFVGGCGKFFEGTADEMLANMQRLRSLADDTMVFCAHEYTMSNLKFLSSIDAELLESFVKMNAAKRDANKPTVPTTIGAEKAFNLFMRCDDASTQGKVGASTAVEAMRLLREMKNNF